MGWISVKDRQPDEYITVLIAWHNKEIERWNNKPPHMQVGIGRLIGSMWHRVDGNFCYGDEITHWMPLPEPPGKEGIT